MEGAPEVAENLFPVLIAVRDAIEFLLEARCEAVLDIVGEEGFQEGCDQTSTVLWHESLLVEHNIVAVLQDTDD